LRHERSPDARREDPEPDVIPASPLAGLKSDPARTVLLVGNHLSGKAGSFGMSESLARKLPEAGWSSLLTSAARRPVARIVDMTAAVWRHRRDYAVAHVDVYSGRAFLWAEVVTWELARLGKPIVLSLRGGNLPEFARRHPRRVRRVFDRASVVTTPSTYLREALAAFRSDLVLLPNALELSQYPFRQRLRAEPRLVWLRAFHEIYNAPLALRVVEALRGEFPELCLTMTGRDRDGSRERALALIVELGLGDRVVVRAPATKAEVPERLQEGDVYLNTARIDNTPVTLLEAMACGVPVVSTRVGGIPHLVSDGENALLVPSDDPAAMADAVRRIVGEPDLARRLSSAGRRMVEGFDWSVILPRWKELLESARAGASRARARS
jgi:glycosyltransferase involved in cell wall biosynthesis